MPPAKPSASIVASAIVAIIGSLLVILIACIVLGTLLARTGASPTPQPPGVRAMSFVFLAVFGAFGVLGICSAVGIWRLRNWARLSFLIYSGMVILVCVFGLAVVWLILPSLPSVQPKAATFMRAFVVIIYAIPAVIGIWWLILFTRKDIARQFQVETLMMEDGLTPLPAKPACPLPIAILAGFWLISVCFLPLLFLMPIPIPMILFGHVIFGRPALGVYVLMSVILAVASIGLLQLTKWSYPLIIGYHLFWCVNATVRLLDPKSWTAMNSVFARMQTPGLPGTFSYNHNQFLGASAGGLVLAIAILVTVLYYRAAFYEQSDRKRNWNSTAALPPATSPTTPPALAP